jgi:predicted DNA-binding transcriptional regulator YafY
MRNLLSAPIEYDRRRRGFSFIEPGWILPAQRISEGELLAFFVAENVLRNIGQSAEAVLLRSALAKLASLLPDEISISISELAKSVSFEGIPSTRVEPYVLSRLARACIESEAVEISYYSPHSQQGSVRKIEPYCLHNFAGDWYVIAFDRLRRAMRDFQAGRIESLTPLSEWFERPSNWNSGEYLSKGFLMTRGGKLTQVEIVFDAYQSQWIRERGKFHPLEKREELEDGRLKLSFKIGQNGLEAVVRFCMTYAGHFEVLRPKRLAEMIRKKARKVLEDHSE